MNVIRGIIGGLAGGILAALALRVRHLVRRDGKPILEAMIELPAIIADDAAHAASSARAAIQDGRDAADHARIAFDEQVVKHARRIEGNDG